MLNALQKRLLNIPTSVLALLMILALVMLLWLPFGLNTTIGGLEEWTALEMVQTGKNALFRWQTHPSRPLIFAPFAVLSIFSSGDLFLGYNLATIALFIAKGMIVYTILRCLIPQNIFVAFMTAALFISYPADDGLFSFRTIGVHTSVFTGLLAIYLLIRYWQQPNRLLWLAIWIVQLVSLLMYEVMYPVLLVSPLLLLWLDRRLTRRFWRVTLLWSIIPATLFIWLIWNILISNQSSYVSNRLAEAQTMGLTNIEAILNRIPPLYHRHLSEWVYTITELVSRSPYLPVALLVGMLVGGVGWKYARQTTSRLDTSSMLTLVGTGFILVFLGYAPFLVSPYVNINWRLYFVSSLGAAFFLAVLVFWLTQRLPILAGCLSGVLMVLATLWALDQHSYFVDSSIYIQRMLGGIVQQAPQIDSDASIVLLDDEASIAQNDWRMAHFDAALQGALSYIYDRPIQAIFCTPPDPIWDPNDTRSCQWQPEGVYRRFNTAESSYPYDRLILFQTLPGGHTELLKTLPSEVANQPDAANYHPERIISQTASLPPRASTFFTCWPLEDCFPLNAPPQEQIRIDFDRMVRGIGWQSVSPSQRQLWMTGKRSTIIVNPVTDIPLEIQFRISRSAAQDVIDSLTLQVNGQSIDIELLDSEMLIFRGFIPKPALRDKTELTFSVNRVVGQYNLGLEFDWLEIRPVAQ